jgi:hypothetical protein
MTVGLPGRKMVLTLEILHFFVRVESPWNIAWAGAQGFGCDV